MQKRAERDRVCGQRAKSPATEPPPSPSLPRVSIAGSHCVRRRRRAHRHAGIPVRAGTGAPGEGLCMNSVLGVRTTRSAANYK